MGTEADRETAFSSWRASLQRLTDSPESSRLWRERRYHFAHRLGEALVGAVGERPPITGAALYGVWLDWGLLYVGQTVEAERRLRDLAIGESHHLANTFPPEIWHRVVVIAWPQLAEAVAVSQELGVKTVGLALEHHLQTWATPLANAARRTSEGGWRAVDRTRSASLGARSAGAVEPLFAVVRSLWDAAADWDAMLPALPEAVRCVRPGLLLDDPRPA
ncbi:MAG TPA: hypothetical protein VGB75_12955 [Jatrophihabitans sp.]|uniref:hypothetical protein n=1 Tax=Jatrophihabitans sp. TaxID=1932789 RepID=UPI002F023694